MFYIFHGDDDFALSEAVADLRGKLAGGDPSMADLNTVVMEGKGLDLGELRHVCDTIPFMADRRLVIVRGLLARLVGGGSRRQTAAEEEPPVGKREFLDKLKAYLPTLPPSTRLIFVEDRALPGSHPILKLVQQEEMAERGFQKLFLKPKDQQLPNWIQHRTRALGGSIDWQAGQLLALLVGSDTRLLDQEIEKLLLYTDGQEIVVDNVRTMVSRAREMSIFDLVDCVGRRETDRALRLLHHMLADGEAPLYLLSMLARQVRILIQVKELQSQGRGQRQIASELNLHPYVVEKGLGQAHSFTMCQLECAHQALLDADRTIKTGGMEDELALDMLVVRLTQN